MSRGIVTAEGLTRRGFVTGCSALAGLAALSAFQAHGGATRPTVLGIVAGDEAAEAFGMLARARGVSVRRLASWGALGDHLSREPLRGGVDAGLVPEGFLRLSPWLAPHGRVARYVRMAACGRVPGRLPSEPVIVGSAVSSTRTKEWLVRRVATAADVPARATRIVELPPSSLPAALESGSVSFACADEESVLRLVREGILRAPDLAVADPLILAVRCAARIASLGSEHDGGPKFGQPRRSERA